MTAGEILTDAEVADVLKLNRKQVQALFRAGQLPGFKVGQYWRTRAEWLQAHIEGATSPSARTASTTPSATVLGLHPASARRIRARAS